MAVYDAKALLTGITLLLVGGCTSVPTVRAYTAPVSTKTESFQNYEINREQIAYIGENIVEKAHLVYTEISDGKYKALVTRGRVPFIIQKGKLYSVRYEDAEDGSIYVNTDGGVEESQPE